MLLSELWVMMHIVARVHYYYFYPDLGYDIYSDPSSILLYGSLVTMFTMDKVCHSQEHSILALA